MPAAAPIPRGPTVLTLYSAADLLTGPGCPVCRYADEAGDRYLAWFALEAHADAVTITRLCSSLGMCPRHTRGLMSQPGAATRLTAVYRYVVEAARDRLRGRGDRMSRCPACERDDGAAGRALDTLLDGLDSTPVRERYRELGGLCIPHLRMASARGGHRVVGWLSETMTAAIIARPASPGWLAGTDHDADMRALLRRTAPAIAWHGSELCVACLATGRSETDCLGEILRASDGDQPDRRLLCGGHLNDLVVLAGQRGASSMLAWQAGCLVAGLTWRPASSPGRPAGCCVPGAAASAAQPAAPYAWPRRMRRSGRSMTCARRCEPHTRPLAAGHRCASGICWTWEHSIPGPVR